MGTAAGHEEPHVPRGADGLRGERDPRGLAALHQRRAHRVRDHPAPGLVEADAVGEQRRGVAIGAHPLHRVVEHGRIAERGEELVLVRPRRRAGIELAVHAVDALLGQAERPDQVLARHAVVRIGVIRRHAALVAPPQLDLVPRQRVGARRQELEQPPGRRAAGERDVEPAPRRDRRPAELDQLVRGGTGHRVEIRELPDRGHAHEWPDGRSLWPPNWNLIADSTFSANDCSMRERNRVKSAAVITSAGTASSTAAMTVQRPSPESGT